MFLSISLATLGLVGSGNPAFAAAQVPTGKWVVNFDDAQCVASRDYGTDQLFLKASPLGDVVQFGVIRPGRTGPPQQVLAEVQPAQGPAYRGSAMLWNAGSKPPKRIRLLNMPEAEFRRLAASATINLKIGEMKQSYALPGMGALAAVMKDCVDDLQKVWSAEGGVSAVATANLATYLKDEDYPAEALGRDFSGTTGFAMLIDEAGRVADCMVVETSGHAILDMQSCAIMKVRARFQPARDGSGKPTRDRVRSNIRWVIPK